MFNSFTSTARVEFVRPILGLRYCHKQQKNLAFCLDKLIGRVLIMYVLSFQSQFLVVAH